MTANLDIIAKTLFNDTTCQDRKNVFLGFSGGLDSTVLLHIAKSHIGGKLTALHVNHGLSADADVWQAHCQRVCEEMGVDFQTTKVQLQREDESSARKARYQWFREVIPRGSLLLTAHHQDDRAETVLFNLMRGAGSAGLSSLRYRRLFYGSTLLRPLLAFSRPEILAYAKQHGLNWVEDQSNTDIRYSRNFIRHKVMPAMQALRSDASKNICRAAANLEQENALLREIAIADLVEVRELPEHPLDASRAICYQDLTELSPARQANLVRFWLQSLNLHIPSKSLLNRLIEAFANPPTATSVIQEEGVQYRFFRDYLYVMPVQRKSVVFKSMQWPDLEVPLNLFQQKVRVGATNKLRDFCNRHQSAQLKLAARPDIANPKAPQGHSLNMKKWMQENKIPPWRRQAQPLLTLSQNNNDVILTAVDQDIYSDWVSLDCPLVS